VIDSRLLSLPAGGAGCGVIVAGGQDPVLRRLSRCHGEAGIRLLSPSSRPSNLSHIVGRAHGGWRSAIVVWSPCVVRPLNSYRICSDAHNIGLFITATISGLPTCRHVITIEYKCIPRQ